MMEALGCKGCRSGQKPALGRQDLGGGQFNVCTGNPPAPHHLVQTPSPPGTTSSGLWRQGRRLFYEHCLGGKTSLNSLRNSGILEVSSAPGTLRVAPRDFSPQLPTVRREQKGLWPQPSSPPVHKRQAWEVLLPRAAVCWVPQAFIRPVTLNQHACDIWKMMS